MEGNGHKTEGLKPIAQLFVNKDGKLVMLTKINNMVILAKHLAQALNSVVKQIPEGGQSKIVVPDITIGQGYCTNPEHCKPGTHDSNVNPYWCQKCNLPFKSGLTKQQGKRAAEDMYK